MGTIDAREVIFKLDGDPDRTFRTFYRHLKHTRDPNADVNMAVKLYPTAGLALKNDIETTDPLGFISKAINGAQGVMKVIKTAAVFFKRANDLKASLGGDNKTTPWLPWTNNALAYKKAGPMKISMDFEFHMGEFGLWDAKEEVFKPIFNLMSLFIPAGISGVNVIPHLPYTTEFIFNFIAGLKGDTKAAANLLSGEKKEEKDNIPKAGIFERISTKVGTAMVYAVETTSSRNVDIELGKGNIVLKKMQPVNCNISFSNKEFDENGYPAYGKISMQFQSYQPATLDGVRSGASAINFGFEISKR